MTTAAFDFLVSRADLHISELCEAPDPSAIALGPGQVLLAIDSFAFTANNVTYAVFGDAMQYWNFFPAREGWGTVPVWGFAVVERSSHPDIKAGERIYGYFPMSTHVVLTADNVTPSGFSDSSPHRRELSAIYNNYSRVTGDPSYNASREAEQALFRPLFLTAYLIDDFLADQDFFGARSVIISSASSKTSISLASCLSRRGRDKCEVVGLTSKGNKAFVEGIGCYHRVVTYDEIASLAAGTPSVFVDMAGDKSVTAAVHKHFGDSLRYSCSVGGTHWENLAFGVEFPGPTPILFFAPAHADKRLAEWGPAQLQKRMGEAWSQFLPEVDGWITVDRQSGADAIASIWLDTLEGRADPKRGYILSF